MKRLIDQICCQPILAFVWSAEMLERRVEGAQMLDAVVSRIVHALNSPASESGPNKIAAGIANNLRGRCCG